LELLGPLEQELTVPWVECLFVDPIGDIAVLGLSDDQELYDKCHTYEALVQSITPLRIADVREEASAQLLSVDREWFGCKVQHFNGGPLLITNAAKDMVGGMSGSPILAEDGSAIGVVCISESRRKSGPHPRLAYHLPTRFLPRP
jgi:hypothetical protein